MRVLLIASTMLATPALAQYSNWPSVNNNLEATRFADQAEITPANVAQLKPICTYDLGRQTSFQTGPVVLGDTMYVTTDFDTIALDAATCAVKWRTTESYKPAGPLQVNRGAAAMDGRIYRGTQDGRVLAYDATTGKRVWQATIANPAIDETVPTALLA